MTAEGKITTKGIAERPLGTVQVLVTRERDTLRPATRKTGAEVAIVNNVEAARGNRRTRYYLTTDLGPVNNLSPSQTFWLAPNPKATPAAVKLTPADIPDTATVIPFSHIRSGDRVQLAADGPVVTVRQAWWWDERTAHRLTLTDGTEVTQPRTGAPDVALHERPGYGPLRHRYTAGDYVTVRGYDDRPTPGVVETVTDLAGGAPWDVAYEVRTIRGGVVRGAEDMAPGIRPEIGQTWVSHPNGQVHTLTVSGFDPEHPCHLVVRDEHTGRRVLLYGPHWALVDSGPHQPSPSVRCCDVCGGNLAGAWWLLRGVGRGWTADRGAACARCAGQPDAGPSEGDEPTGEHSKPFVSAWASELTPAAGVDPTGASA